MHGNKERTVHINHSSYVLET